ncbi:MAG TPA: DUF4255 domain-containing protein [Bacteroidia bacterium]|nr:DUF4255 domain-containing protein [Bacteroidia bacterium]
MDYTGLNEITATLISVIQTAIDPAFTVRVFPEILKNERNGVGFYLYHVTESNHYKNYPAAGLSQPPVSFTPMALNLFYQLSANWKEGEIEDAIEEQRLMSLAMKVLHDHSIMKRTIPTGINPQGKDIDIKITLQTLTPAESVQYWAASESSVRLSAYYEVSVIFLEPEKPTSYAGRVLSYGNYVFVQGAPQISATQNTINYNIPGGPPSQVIIQPAQAPPAIVNPAPADCIVTIKGTSFYSGNLKVLFTGQHLTQSAEATAAWQVTRVSENQVDFTVQPTAVLQDAAATVVDMIPGIYAVQVSITMQATLPDGTVKIFTHTSNQFPFSVTPRIDQIVPSGPRFIITGHRFQHPHIKTTDIQVYLENTSLVLKVSAGQPAAGEFKITGANTIEINPPASIHGPRVPLRILVKGVESGPNWINIP